MVVVVAAVAAISAECHAAASLVAEWARAARVGAVLIGTVPAIGTAAAAGMAVIGAVATTGMAIIGVATTGTATGKIRTANGVGGTATGGAIPGTTSYSLAILAFPGGGAGVGALGQAEAGAADTRTVTTVTVILTTVVVATRTTATAMATATDTAPSTSLTTAVAANPESPSCNGGCHGLVITVDPSTESWGRKRGAQSGCTSKNTVT